MMCASNMKWDVLNLEKISIYKAIAILLIVIHNFMHWLPGPAEMEFDYEEGKFFFFFESVFNEPERFFQFLMSYFGHFGVQIFIFLSAYGLTKKFLIGTSPYWQFIVKRVWSIYPSFLIAIIFWAVITADYNVGRSAPVVLLFDNIESLLYKVMLVSNFMSDERLRLVGPWWFISLIFQVYFLYPLLFRLLAKFGNLFLLAISVLSISLMILTNGSIGDVNLNFTIVGHLPEICLGMYLANIDNKPVTIPLVVIFIALGVYLVGNLVAPIWFLNHVSILLVMLVFFKLVTEVIERTHYVKIFMLFIGAISMHLFLVNGFLRYPFIGYVKIDNTWVTALLYCFVSVTTSVCVAFVLSKSELLLKYTLKKIFNNL